MSTLQERIAQDLKQAMRAKDKARIRTLRSITAALKKKEIELREGGEARLTEQQELAVLQKEAKQRRESIEQYRAGGREDLVQKEAEELAIIEEYLPKQLDDEEIEKILRDIIEVVGAKSRRDMGKVMGQAMKRLRGLADGKRVQEIAQKLLAELEEQHT